MRQKPMRAGSVVSAKSKSSTGVIYMKPIRKERTKHELEEFKKELSLDDHLISLNALALRYMTNLQTGLTKTRADELLKINGPNILVPPIQKSKWLVLAEFIFGGFNVLLWIGTAFTFLSFGLNYNHDWEEALDSLYLGVVLVSVILFTGLFGFYQENTNRAIMDSFKKMIPKFATVIRSGDKIVIPSEEIVEGDLVEIKAGDMVPADIRVIESKFLKVDMSSVTGETMPIAKSPELTDRNPLETMNLAFYGTLVTQGQGSGIVIKCGDDTVIGRIAGLTTALETDQTLLKKEIKIFIKIITIFAVVIAVVFFCISMAIGYTFFKSFTFFIAIMVANVPEGLPVTLTACMTLTAQRMAKKNCLVKKLEGIETLGSCNVICSDKTGTLTQNIMTAAHFYYDNKEFDVLSSFDTLDRRSPTFDALCRAGMLCSRASFLEYDILTPIQQRKTIGDATQVAILKVMERIIGNVAGKRLEAPKVCEIPYNSTSKFHATIHNIKGEGFLLFMIGAPERILDRCSTILIKGQEVEMNHDQIRNVKIALNDFGRMGERVLGFADLHLNRETYKPNYKFNAEDRNFPITELRFLGLISMIDPPRPSVPEAVARCKSAGIKVIMVTGDHPITATAIAKKVGILSPDASTSYEASQKDKSIMNETDIVVSAAVVTGSDLMDMEQSDLQNILKSYDQIVFARTSPQQKLKIVEALQKMGMIVAVTGDGVNDSPALKKANIGIAMGITGTDVSKEAADMIILDDNFASIVTGIEEGRLIFDNLKKSIAFVLTSNIPEIVPFMLLVTLNIPEALSVMAILVINVGTDLFPAISLAYEKAEADIMRRTPRDSKKDKLVNHRMIYLAYGQVGLLQTCAGFAVYFFIMAQYGFFYDRLIGIRMEWDNKYINDLKDSYGQEWTYAERMILKRKCITGYYLALVLTQVADLLACKTRRLSLFQQGLGNQVLNIALLGEIAISAIVVYVPIFYNTFMLHPIEPFSVTPALPFALIIFVYDEIRKYLIRKFPDGFMARETYY